MRIRILLHQYLCFLGHGVAFFLTSLIVGGTFGSPVAFLESSNQRHSGSLEFLFKMIAHGNMRHTDVPDTPLFGVILVLADRDSSI